jgi:hypothetical protein
MDGSHCKHERLDPILTACLPTNLSTWPCYRPAALKLSAACFGGRIEAGDQFAPIEIEPALNEGSFVHYTSQRPEL